MIDKQTNPFLFACGVPRSGTTLLQRMLNSHPDLAVANDSHFIPRALEKTDKGLVALAEKGVSIEMNDRIFESVRSYHRLYRLGLSDEQLKSARDKSATYQQFVAAIYGAFAANAGKKIAGEKTPDYIRRVTLLKGLFPQAKLIHLIRDGRDVALSLMDWAKPNKGPGRIALWADQPVSVSALWWRWLVMSGHQQLAELSNKAIEVRYDSLTNEPERTSRRLCQFLDLAYSSEMLQFNRGKTRAGQKLSAKSAWLGPQKGLRNWRTDMGEDDVALFEALAGDALDLFGFEVRNQSFSSQIQDRARGCRQWWANNFEAKSKQVLGEVSSP